MQAFVFVERGEEGGSWKILPGPKNWCQKNVFVVNIVMVYNITVRATNKAHLLVMYLLTCSKYT